MTPGPTMRARECRTIPRTRENTRSIGAGLVDLQPRRALELAPNQRVLARLVIPVRLHEDVLSAYILLASLFDVETIEGTLALQARKVHAPPGVIAESRLVDIRQLVGF